LVATIGYARVSTDHQSLDAQRDPLQPEGCERIFTDQLTGASQDRPGLRAMFDFALSGDLVVVVALDRLGGSLSGVIRTLETWRPPGCCCAPCGKGSTTPPRPGRCSPASWGSGRQKVEPAFEHR